MADIQRRLATFRTIDAIDPIEGADAIEVATIGGWKVVTKKDEFKPGDGCIYFEIDSFLPDGVPAWQFLVDKQGREFEGAHGHRLRTVKLRGQISQGFILHATALPQTKYLLALDVEAQALQLPFITPEQKVMADVLRAAMVNPEINLDPRDLDLTELLGIKKWEQALPASLSGQAEGMFPSFIRRTDQERCQNLVDEIFQFEGRKVEIDVSGIPSDALETMKAKSLLIQEDDKWLKIDSGKADANARYEVTLKLDGSSMTAFARRATELLIESGVCSRNLQLKVNDANADNSFVRMAVKSGLLAALESMVEEGGYDIAVQGELMGPGIQDNREQLKDFQFFIFDAQRLDGTGYLNPEERYELMKDLYQRGVNPDMVKHVPIVAYQANLLDTLGIKDVSGLLRFAERPSINHPVAEGVVFKRLDGKFSFKAISNQYLQKQKD